MTITKNLFYVLELSKLKLSMMVVLTGLLGLLITAGPTSLQTILGFTISLLFIVSGSCILNCFIERDIDKKMKRTANRPLATGEMNPRVALNWGVVLVALSVIGFVLFTNIHTAILGLIACVFYLFIYTPLKTQSLLSLFMGAIPGALPPLMGQVAFNGELTFWGVWLFLLLFAWQIPHFLAISVYYEEDYGSADIKVFSQEVGLSFTVKLLFYSTFILALISSLPFIFRSISLNAFFAVSLCNLLFLGLAVKVLLNKKSDCGVKWWSRVYFFGSLVYLPIVLLFVLVFK